MLFKWAIPVLFFIYFRLLYTVDSKFAIIAIMTGFEPHTSCVRSDRSSNLATTTASDVGNVSNFSQCNSL